MASLKKFDFGAKQVGEVTLADELLDVKCNRQIIKEYLVAMHKNARQWSACTKDRSEVKARGQKPQAQKGLGRARQGCLAAPQFKGGGIVFGPKPKFDQHVRINRKERRAAIRFLLAEKIKENKIHVISTDQGSPSKTKEIAAFLKGMQLTGKRVLVLGQNPEELIEKSKNYEIRKNVARSLRNIPKVEFVFMPKVNAYDIVLCREVFILDSALDEFLAILGKASGE